MAYFIIPVNAYPESFSISLDGISYSVTTRYNEYVNQWCIDMISDIDGSVIMLNQPVLAGIDLAEQYRFKFANSLVTWTNGVADGLVDPTYDNFGTDAELQYVNQL